MVVTVTSFLTAVVVCAALTLWRDTAKEGSKSKIAAEFVTGVMVCAGVLAWFDAAMAALIGS